MAAVETGLNDRLMAIISAMGYEFVGCEWYRDARQSALRIYIDKEGGVTVTDCTGVSRQVGAVLDVEERVQGHYSLEVSSPGINRPLFSPEQYQRQVGQVVNVRLRVPHEGRRHLKGVLCSANAQDLCIAVEGDERVVPMASVLRAHLVAEVFPKKGSKGGRRGARGSQTGSGVNREADHE